MVYKTIALPTELKQHAENLNRASIPTPQKVVITVAMFSHFPVVPIEGIEPPSTGYKSVVFPLYETGIIPFVRE